VIKQHGVKHEDGVCPSLTAWTPKLIYAITWHNCQNARMQVAINWYVPSSWHKSHATRCRIPV